MNLTALYAKLGLFFDERALLFLNKREINRRDLCYIAGRDYRVWTDQVYDDLIRSYVKALDLSPTVTLLEVGCASGFLAQGLCPYVREYFGIDLSPASLKIAYRLGLPNAHFRPADGAALPYKDGSFDRVLCSDVFSNISDMDLCRKIIAEMLRVTKPGGLLLVASIFDARTQDSYPQRIQEVNKLLPPVIEDPDVAMRKWMPWYYKVLLKLRRRLDHGKAPVITNCYHDRQFYLDLGKEIGSQVEILPFHPLNPYADYRFNVLFRK